LEKIRLKGNSLLFLTFNFLFFIRLHPLLVTYRLLFKIISQILTLVNKESLEKIIQHAIAILHDGGVLLYPADTIWGIGCDATNKEAIKKVYEIKGRDYTKPLIVLVSNLSQLYEVVAAVHPRVETLLHYHERPLTVIYPSVNEAYKHLAAADGSIGVRVVKTGFCHALLEGFERPLISTSANLSGEPSPTKFGSISTEIISRVDYAVPAFTEKGLTGIPSVIARYDANGELDFIRYNQ
jgi:L-threonylcarbamoyladenylate synthase